MRNLKRVLSLAMASIMLVGMMMVGASAVEFPDSDKIEHTDAVNTLVTLGVIKGKDDGTFDPEGIVTRAEMAKMICVALNGGKDPNLSGAGLYPDTKGHWAAGYIDYCTNIGVVSGDNKGNFNPNNTVTGVEAAKMILIAIGFNAENEKYVNDPNWDTNIGVDASSKDLYKDVAIVPTEGLTRDNAAQMIRNGMDAIMVEYDYKVGAVDGNVTSIAIAKDVTSAKNTILKAKFDLDTDEDVVLTGVKPVTSGVNKGTFMLYTGAAGVDGTADYTKVTEDYTALLGQTVNVLHKMGKTDEVYGVYASGNNNTVTTAQSAITDASGKVKFDDTKYELDNCIKIVDGEVVYTSAGGVDTATTFDSDEFVKADSYDNITFVDNDGDDKYEVAVVTTVTPAKVTYVSSSEIIAGGETYKYDDHDIDDGLSKGDYVTVVYNIAEDKNTIETLEALEGTVTGTKSSPTKYQIEGEWYLDAASLGVSAGDDISAYIVNGVIYAGEKTASSTLTDVAVLVKYVASGMNPQVRLMYGDGTTVTGNLDTSSKSPNAPGGTFVVSDDDQGALVTVKEVSNGYRLTKVSGDIGSNKWLSNKAVADDGGSPAKITTIGTKSVDDSAVIFVSTTDGQSKVITGKQLKTLAADASNANEINTTAFGAFTSKVGGLDRVTFASVKVNGTTLPSGGRTDNNYALVLSDSYTVTDATTYDVYINGEKVTVRDEDKTDVSKGDVIVYDSLDGDVIKNVGKIAADTDTTLDNTNITNVSIQGKDGDYLWLNGQVDGTDKYEITKDTQIMYYDSADMAGKPDGEIVLADDVEGVYVENAKAVVNTGSKEISFLLVDVKNKLATATEYIVTFTESADRLASISAKKGDDALTSGTSKAKAGDIITVTLTGAAAAGDVTVTVSSGVIMESASATTKNFTVANDGTVSFQVVVGGALNITVANKA